MHTQPVLVTAATGYAGGTVIQKAYRVRVQAGPEEAWASLVRLGGQTGWYFADFPWRLRGRQDKLAGGSSWWAR